MRTALFALTLSAVVPSISLPAAASPSGVQQEQRGDPQSASLRRTLMSVVLLKKLNLTPEQKASLQGLIVEARASREKLASDPAVVQLRTQRQALLEKAIAEARATGSVSAETREAMKSLRESGRQKLAETKGERQALKAKLAALLTPEQVESVKSLKGEAREGRFHGRGFLFHLLMSEEFSTELAR